MVVGSGVGTTKFKWAAGCLKHEILTLYYRDLGLTAFPLFTDSRHCENDAFIKRRKILAIPTNPNTGLKIIIIMMKIKQKKVGHFQHHPLLDICFMLDLQVCIEFKFLLIKVK